MRFPLKTNGLLGVIYNLPKFNGHPSSSQTLSNLSLFFVFSLLSISVAFGLWSRRVLSKENLFFLFGILINILLLEEGLGTHPEDLFSF